MPDISHDSLLNAFVVGSMVLSAIAGLQLAVLRRSGPLLQFEPRQPVPWNFSGALLPILLLGMTIFEQWHSHGKAKDMQASGLLNYIVGQSVVVGGFLFVVAVLSGASRFDLGLPRNFRQVLGDCFIGAIACLAALAPIHIVQICFVWWLFPNEKTSGHPLIKMVESGPLDFTLLLLTGVTAVLVAPVCEEIMFRLLLQGWLEKWEDRRLHWRSRDQAAHQNIESAASGANIDLTADQPPDDSPPRIGAFGIAHGWVPILVSATLFGIAHYGYGPEPVPLFLFGLVLGYLYQRTHRILPGIVAHALFNLFTMIVLWRMLYHHA